MRPGIWEARRNLFCTLTLPRLQRPLILALQPHPRLPPNLQAPGDRSTSYPSLLSHLTSMYLNTPPLALPVAKTRLPGPDLRSFHPLASALPCDFHLLNLRTLPAEVSVTVTDSEPLHPDADPTTATTPACPSPVSWAGLLLPLGCVAPTSPVPCPVLGGPVTLSRHGAHLTPQGF
jgi:hypothetical protein